MQFFIHVLQILQVFTNRVYLLFLLHSIKVYHVLWFWIPTVVYWSELIIDKCWRRSRILRKNSLPSRRRFVMSRNLRQIPSRLIWDCCSIGRPRDRICNYIIVLLNQEFPISKFSGSLGYPLLTERISSTRFVSKSSSIHVVLANNLVNITNNLVIQNRSLPRFFSCRQVDDLVGAWVCSLSWMRVLGIKERFVLFDWFAWLGK